MAKTIVQICGQNKERRFYGHGVGNGTVLGKPGSVTKGTLANEDWCPVHDQPHASMEVVVEIPFTADDYYDQGGQFDIYWSIRFDQLASARADKIIFEANQTG